MPRPRPSTRSAKRRSTRTSRSSSEAAPWNIGRFDGSSYFVDPRGNVIALGSEDKDELVVAEMDLDMIEDVRRVWQFHRDRHSETDGSMAEQLP